MGPQQEHDLRTPETGQWTGRNNARPRMAQTNDLMKDLGWDSRRELGLHPALPDSRWRRVLALWGFSATPFLSASDELDRRL